MQSLIENIALITQFYNSPIAKEAILAQTTRNEDFSINNQALVELLKSYGFENKISKKPISEIPSLATPLILFLKDNESLILLDIKKTSRGVEYLIQQQDLPKQIISQEKLEELYLGYCWFIKPKIETDHRSELPEYMIPKAWFWQVIARFKNYYYQVILASFIINILALIGSLYVMNVYDRVIPNKTFETLWVLSIGVIFAISFEFLTKLLRGYLTDTAGKKADLIISANLFKRVLALKMEAKPASSGSYANNLREFESVREFMTSASLLVLVDLPFLLLFVLLIAFIAGKLALVPLFIIPIVIAVGIAVQPKMSKYINEATRESSQRQGLAVEAVEGIETLKTHNATIWAQQKWDYFTAKTANSQSKVKNLSNFMINFATAMQQLNTVILVIVGTYLINSTDDASRITMGALIASVILSGRALAPLAQIASLANRFQQARLALMGIDVIMQKPTERNPHRNYVRLDKVQGQIKFDKVNFQYKNSANNAVDTLNITINPGEKIAILGKVGSGKSTLLKLASGLYETQSGNITLDNIDLRQIDPHFLRTQVLMLGQEPRLFLGTLRENLDLARSDNFSSDHDLLLALERFGLDKMVQNHPRGLDMPLGENGLGLSGGQKQLVSLARMTLKDPKIVLLDEPTSDLDQNTEIDTLKTLGDWCKNRTLVVVTHRLPVLQLVDRIIVMDNGKVVLDGEKEQILQILRGEPIQKPVKITRKKIDILENKTK